MLAIWFSFGILCCCNTPVLPEMQNFGTSLARASSTARLLPCPWRCRSRRKAPPAQLPQCWPRTQASKRGKGECAEAPAGHQSASLVTGRKCKKGEVLSAPAHARSITCPRVRDKATYVLAPATSAPPCFCSAKARANSMPSVRFFFSHKEYGAGDRSPARGWASRGLWHLEACHAPSPGDGVILRPQC